MSEIDDGEDLEFLRAFEDELYNDTSSDGSDDILDSELEAELYQSVHFASSLVETPKNNSKEETHADDPTSSTSLDSETNRSNDSENSDKESVTDHVDAKPSSIDEKKNSNDSDDLREICTNFYPEVELVFSKHEDKKKLIYPVKKATAEKLFEAKEQSDVLDNSLSDSDQWGVIAADLIPSRKRKKRSGRCFNCNEIGHRTLECTQPKKEKICWLCGEVGHLKKRCHNELCFNCSQPGHQVKNCRKPRCRSEDRCNRCHAFGHFESFCPDRWRQYHYTIEKGEIVRGLQSDLKRTKMYCYNCGMGGHLGHECLEDTDGPFYGAFPFVVKYDKYTSEYSIRNISKNTPSDDNARLTDNSPRKPDRKSDLNDCSKVPSSSEQNVDGLNKNTGNQIKKKSKKRKRKKRSGGEVMDEEENARKRRRVEGEKVIPRDHKRDQGQFRDQTLRYTEDSCDQMETFTNFNHTASNLPLQPLMSMDVDFMASRGRKRRRNNAHEENKLSSEGTETVVKKKKSRPNKRQRKKMRLQQTSSSNEIVHTPPSLPAGNREVKKTKKRKGKKKDNINLEALSSTVYLNTLSHAIKDLTKGKTELRETNKNHFKDERRVVFKETPKNTRKTKPKNSRDDRKVYFNNSGFL